MRARETKIADARAGAQSAYRPVRLAHIDVRQGFLIGEQGTGYAFLMPGDTPAGDLGNATNGYYRGSETSAAASLHPALEVGVNRVGEAIAWIADAAYADQVVAAVEEATKAKRDAWALVEIAKRMAVGEGITAALALEMGLLRLED